ncbi:lytic transglycosylase domain-containing protein [Frigidibacter sp. ROC022]|uniref:lytic transglycosylase domain-containing protein n=1 Tax=Frigidibacter sp. ROC022 TaxID=2971796 RepID=UPI00215AF67C|nr:lytic transglycosylase domain-containing protein [Frigidibacter sp. ROC022]MCR8723659.1 lytic transglycosylase domain-containing protein [Frigidibacter sp. ROC022]
MRIFPALGPTFGLTVLLCAGGLAPVAPVVAGDAPEFKDFTFKRVAAPKKGSTAKRITVQITEPYPPPPGKRKDKTGDKAGEGDDAGNAVAAAPAGDAYAWYWNAVSPDIGLSPGGGRFLAAVEALSKAPAGKGVNAPRLQTLQGIAAAHGTEILKATIGTKVSPALVLAVIAVESGGNAAAVSGAGAQGLMQLMPDTAARFGVTEATDPVQNIKGGVAYLDWLMGEFSDDAVLALAGYNAGEGAVRKNAGVPPYPETRGYVPKVLAAWKVARGLCVTPPQLPGDGCVFMVRAARND